MALLTEAGGCSLLSDSRIAATEEFDAPLELLNGSNSSVATPPTFGDDPREGLRKPEDQLRCCVAYAVRPEFVAQPEDVCESLLDVVKAQQWKLKAVREGRRERRLPRTGRSRHDHSANVRHPTRMPRAPQSLQSRRANDRSPIPLARI